MDITLRSICSGLMLFVFFLYDCKLMAVTPKELEEAFIESDDGGFYSPTRLKEVLSKVYRFEFPSAFSEPNAVIKALEEISTSNAFYVHAEEVQLDRVMRLTAPTEAFSILVEKQLLPFDRICQLALLMRDQQFALFRIVDWVEAQEPSRRRFFCKRVCGHYARNNH